MHYITLHIITLHYIIDYIPVTPVYLYYITFHALYFRMTRYLVE